MRWILLDNCVLGNLAAEDGPEVDVELLANAVEGTDFHVAIPDGAIFELARGLVSGKPTFAQWQNAVKKLDNVLSWEWPVLPSGVVLRHHLGLARLSERDLAMFSTHARAIRYLFTSASHARDLQRVYVPVTPHNVEGFKVGPMKDPEPIWSRERSNYIGVFDGEPPKIVKDFPKLAQTYLDDLADSTHASDEALERIRPVAELLAWARTDNQRKRNGYNPESDKNRGDAFDLNLLWFLGIPAIICTADDRFLGRLASAKILTGAQREGRAGGGGIVGVETLNKMAKEGSLHKLLRDS